MENLHGFLKKDGTFTISSKIKPLQFQPINYNIIDHNNFQLNFDSSKISIQIMTQIPLLVKEKVQFYLQKYYHEEWLLKNKKLITEYGKQIKIYISHGAHRRTIAIEMYWGYITVGYFIRHLSYLHLHSKHREIRTFNKLPKKNHPYVAKLPKFYYYSSGLNDPTGYK